MGRKRLIALLTGLTLVVPLPTAALQATASLASDQDTGATTASEDDDVVVPLPGGGEVSAGGDLDPAGSAEVRVSADLRPAGVPVATDVDVAVSGSAEDGADVDASAPTTVGETTVDPVEVVAPVLDEVRAVTDGPAPGVVPDVRPAQPDSVAPADGGDADVRAAAAPTGGGFRAGEGVNVPARSVVERPAQTPRSGSESSVDVFDVASRPASPAGDDATVAADPQLPGPFSLPTLLKVLAALLVLAAGFTNRVVAARVR